ncbi:uncharacterized protein LOC114299627 isoform X2 [Camellia sinensis]|uniref:uncharacterized protein LOC114299627 isoform X2 n=1 Tax=Camellia sinensis TaxID=4442 RepID=UPI001035A0AA|nr:uncharacterized protein LOC114299627 isoform X2 [Camellia sinensis]
MRPCLSNAVRLQADELTRETFRGSKWLVLRYGIYNLDIIHAAVRIAKQEGVSVSLDLASFEMVRDFRAPLLKLLESGDVDLCFANEDEATEVVSDLFLKEPKNIYNFTGLSQPCCRRLDKSLAMVARPDTHTSLDSLWSSSSGIESSQHRVITEGRFRDDFTWDFVFIFYSFFFGCCIGGSISRVKKCSYSWDY